MTVLFYFALFLQTRVVARIAVSVPVDPARDLEAVTHHAAFSFMGIGGDSVALSWQASPDHSSPFFSGYQVWRANAAAGGKFSEIEAGVMVTDWTDTAVARKSTYRYYVVAAAGKATAPASNTVLVRTR